MKTISLKLPERLDAKLTAMATRCGRPKSALVREALEAYLADGAGGVTCLDLVEDLIGCIDGPGDLSTNKEHFRDFGK